MSKYRAYSDKEFERLLETDPDNLDLVYEASYRFRKRNDIEVPADVGDSFSGFPDEDFAAGVIDKFRQFSETLKGAAKKECESLIETLCDLEREVYQQAEYGRSELNEVQSALEAYAGANP